MVGGNWGRGKPQTKQPDALVSNQVGHIGALGRLEGKLPRKSTLVTASMLFFIKFNRKTLLPKLTDKKSVLLQWFIYFL